MRQCERPAINFGSILNSDWLTQIDVVDARVENKKTVSVPEGIDERTRNVCNDVDRDTFLYVGRQACKEIPAQCIRTDRIEDIIGIDDIAERLRHLLAVLVDDMTQTDAILVGDAVGYERGNCMQRVKPATRLINGLANEICRKM